MFFHGRLPAWAVPLSIPSGFLVGSKLAGWLGGYDVWALMFRNPIAMRNTIIDTSLIAGAITAFFLYFSYTRGVKRASEQNRRRAAEALQAETASRLALLQAQIEPHFLFNTLAKHSQSDCREAGYGEPRSGEAQQLSENQPPAHPTADLDTR